MPDFDRGFKIVARNAGQGLTRLAGVTVQRWEAIGDTLQTTERLADRAFRAESRGRRFVVYMEEYTRWAESAVWSVLAKSALLSERERLPTLSLVFVLLPEGYRDQRGTFRLEVADGEPTQQVWFREVRLWEQHPEPWWERLPGIMPLYPLTRHELPLPEAVAHAANVIQRRELDGYRRADLLTTLAFFGRLRDRRLDVLSIIGREQMKASELFPELAREAEVARARKYILHAIELRFGAAAAKEFEKAVGRVENLDQLEALHGIAIKGRRVTQFRKALEGMELP